MGGQIHERERLRNGADAAVLDRLRVDRHPDRATLGVADADHLAAHRSPGGPGDDRGESGRGEVAAVRRGGAPARVERRAPDEPPPGTPRIVSAAWLVALITPAASSSNQPGGADLHERHMARLKKPESPFEGGARGQVVDAHRNAVAHGNAPHPKGLLTPLGLVSAWVAGALLALDHLDPAGHEIVDRTLGAAYCANDGETAVSRPEQRVEEVRRQAGSVTGGRWAQLAHISPGAGEAGMAQLGSNWPPA